jgi:hypothetical protein
MRITRPLEFFGRLYLGPLVSWASLFLNSQTGASSRHRYAPLPPQSQITPRARRPAPPPYVSAATQAREARSVQERVKFQLSRAHHELTRVDVHRRSTGMSAQGPAVLRHVKHEFEYGPGRPVSPRAASCRDRTMEARGKHDVTGALTASRLRCTRLAGHFTIPRPSSVQKLYSGCSLGIRGLFATNRKSWNSERLQNFFETWPGLC